MKEKSVFILKIIFIVYWGLSSVALFFIESGYDIFTYFLNYFLYPGYYIGFFMSAVLGTPWAILGQLISLGLFFIVIKILSEFQKEVEK